MSTSFKTNAIALVSVSAMLLSACAPKEPAPAAPAASAPAPTATTTAPNPPSPAPAKTTATTPGDYDAGKKVYQTICFACHQATGLGIPPAFPPLAGSEIATAADPGHIIRIVLHGLQGPITVKGTNFMGVMPGQGASLSDQQIADVLTYVRGAWSNTAAPVAVEAVAAARAATAGRTTMWTWAELTAGNQ